MSHNIQNTLQNVIQVKAQLKQLYTTDSISLEI
jgi:hypothetical protein